MYFNNVGGNAVDHIKVWVQSRFVPRVFQKFSTEIEHVQFTLLI